MKAKAEPEKKGSAERSSSANSDVKEKAEKKHKEAARKKDSSKSARSAYLYPLAIVAVVIAILAIALTGSTLLSNVSFPSFKQNFDSAPRVAVVVYFYNASVYGLETTCTTALVEVLASHRNPSTIDFFTIDNKTCTYIPNGIGHVANVLTTNSTSCLNTAASEPSISLNYGPVNKTSIAPYHLSIHGNREYLRSCPIAVDLS